MVFFISVWGWGSYSWWGSDVFFIIWGEVDVINGNVIKIFDFNFFFYYNLVWSIVLEIDFKFVLCLILIGRDVF